MNRTAFPAAYALLRASADLADHWVQTHHQACRKAEPGPAGHRALAGHVATYVATQAAALTAGNRLLGLGLSGRGMAAALAVSGATHYLIDRRWPVKRLAEATGKSEFYELGGPLGGAYRLDQAAHHTAEAIAAILAARI
ncbi:transcriptional regulator [Streptomyces verrucosisporus]|uniref:transcriptional regulator n=1 Tax=Streptomyces verrucosisporus TaxID=1695161 RepID=UPI0019D2A8B1|nr:transcriptional regulator [Streptomyces verrucosisporus]MBN3928941.1 transcriptional regulator [Streptomyces verrucosisporus]